MYERFDVLAWNYLAIGGSLEYSLLRFGRTEQFVLSWFLGCQRFMGGVDGGVEIIDKAFLAHVMDDFARGVVCAETFATIFLDKVFEDLAEHFGINGHFFFQRLGLVNGEVVPVENVEDTGAGDAFLDEVGVGEQLVWQDDVGLLPIVIAERFEKTAVEEWYAAFEPVDPCRQ